MGQHPQDQVGQGPNAEDKGQVVVADEHPGEDAGQGPGRATLKNPLNLDHDQWKENEGGREEGLGDRRVQEEGVDRVGNRPDQDDMVAEIEVLGEVDEG